MTSYAEMARRRKKARSLYLEIRTLRLELYAKEDPHDATGYRVRVAGLHSLPETHAEPIRRLVEASIPGQISICGNLQAPPITSKLSGTGISGQRQTEYRPTVLCILGREFATLDASQIARDGKA